MLYNQTACMFSKFDFRKFVENIDLQKVDPLRHLFTAVGKLSWAWQIRSKIETNYIDAACNSCKRLTPSGSCKTIVGLADLEN